MFFQKLAQEQENEKKNEKPGDKQHKKVGRPSKAEREAAMKALEDQEEKEEKPVQE